MMTAAEEEERVAIAEWGTTHLVTKASKYDGTVGCQWRRSRKPLPVKTTVLRKLLNQSIPAQGQITVVNFIYHSVYLCIYLSPNVLLVIDIPFLPYFFSCILSLSYQTNSSCPKILGVLSYPQFAYTLCLDLIPAPRWLTFVPLFKGQLNWHFHRVCLKLLRFSFRSIPAVFSLPYVSPSLDCLKTGTSSST